VANCLTGLTSRSYQVLSLYILRHLLRPRPMKWERALNNDDVRLFVCQSVANCTMRKYEACSTKTTKSINVKIYEKCWEWTMKVDHCIQYHDVITNPVWWTTANMKIVVNQSIKQTIQCIYIAPLNKILRGACCE